MSNSSLAKLALQHSHIVELGATTGESTRTLVDNTLGMVSVISSFDNGAFDTFLSNIVDVVPGKLAVFLDDPKTAANKWNMGLIDMIFVNSLPYEDIADWEPLVSRGGLICGQGPDTLWIRTL